MKTISNKPRGRHGVPWLRKLGLVGVAPATALPALGAPAIPNPSFEADTFTVGQGHVAENTPITGWTAIPTNRVGLNPVGSANPFADNGKVPHGTKVAFIRSVGNNKSSLSTTITGLTPGGIYRVLFRTNVQSSTTVDATWSIDGSVPAKFLATQVNAAGVHTAPYRTIDILFIANSATAQLEISNTTSAPSTLLVDKFTVSSPVPIVVQNTNSDGPGSLRQALDLAEDTPGFHTIKFAPALSGQTVNLFEPISIQDFDGLAIDAADLPAGIKLKAPSGVTSVFGLHSSVIIRGIAF